MKEKRNTIKDPSQKVYRECIEALCDWCESNDISVNLFSSSHGYDPDTHEITLHHGSAGSWLHIVTLIHEIGHAVQPNSAFHSLRKSVKRDKAIIIELEYTAWQCGWDVVKSLRLNTSDLWYHYSRAWMTYWSAYIQHVYVQEQHEVYSSIYIERPGYTDYP